MKTFAYIAAFALATTLLSSCGGNSGKYCDTKGGSREVTSRSDSAERNLVGQRVPDFKITGTDGKVFLFSEIRDTTKTTLVNFWATWCEPCKKDLDLIAGLNRKYAAENLDIISISCDDSAEEWNAALASGKYPWRHFIDSDKEAFQNFRGRYIPMNIVIDGTGKIVAIDVRDGALQSAVGDCLKNKKTNNSDNEL